MILSTLGHLKIIFVIESVSEIQTHISQE